MFFLLLLVCLLASGFSSCFRWTDEDETKLDVFLQVLHHHLSPGEVTGGVGSIVRVGFSFAAPRPHAHFIQDVFQLYFTADIWRKRRSEEEEERGGGGERRKRRSRERRLSELRNFLQHLTVSGPMMIQKNWTVFTKEENRFHGDSCFLTT